MSAPRVLVALSGGVDSSVSALLLQQQGYDVVGVFLRNGVAKEHDAPPAKQGCCSAEDSRDAALVADRLGIPYHAVDMETEFVGIMDYFADAYRKGHTPNPCIRCNRDIKFGALWKMADALGAEYLATGHYARIQQGDQGPQLLRGLDPNKDQSYVLFPLPEDRLARTLLPVGELQKSVTRQLAEDAGLPVFGKPDSVEICFVPSGDYRDLLRHRGGLGTPGRIVDREGRGQRRGLGFAATEPMYVLDISPETGDVIVGPRSATGCAAAEVEEFHTFGCTLESGESWNDVAVQFRSTPGGVGADLVCTEEGKIQVSFHNPAASVNPGQGLAVYRGDRLLGGGWVSATRFSDSLQV
ncbi:MAG: tRNA 2-thiouridine(34) synthase MnmA [Planctomycetota bacterium]|jgi:tRNA-specific 2-thiouridylase